MSADLPRAFHLPRNVPEPPLETRQFHKLTALVPKLDADFIKLVCARLKENRRGLTALANAGLLAAFVRARDAMFDMARLGETLAQTAAATGMSECGISWNPVNRIGGLGWGGTRISDWLSHENLRLADIGTRARGPDLIFHVLAGIASYPAFVTMMSGLLARSGNLVKTSSAEPVSAVRFAECLSLADPTLGDCLAVLPWPGGSEELESAALECAGLATIYGDDNTVTKLRARAPAQCRVLTHPHRFSIGFVARNSNSDETVYGAANDIGIFDLTGCLSPQALFVEGDSAEFGDRLAAHLRQSPRFAGGDRLPADVGSIRRSREKAEFAELSGRGVRLLASENLDWTIVVQERPLRPFQLFNRVVNVVGIDHHREIAGLLGESAKSLSCVGVSVTPERRDEVVDFLVELGAKRICKLGEMQTPPLAWHHDGRFHLADFLEWTDVEI